MTQQFVVSLGKETITTVLSVAAPMLLAGLITGVSVSVFQSITQLRDMTLTFVPKIVAVAVTLVFVLPWIMNIIISFANNIFLNVGDIIK